MCLLTNEHRPKIAKEDITVWKIVHIAKDNKTVLTGPYFNHFSYDLGVLYKNDFPLKKRRDEDCYGNKIYAVEAAFHSYNDLDEALSRLRTFKELLLNTDYVLVECTIPKGTKYYTDVTEPEIASEQIKINKIIKDDSTEQLDRAIYTYNKMIKDGKSSMEAYSWFMVQKDNI